MRSSYATFVPAAQHRQPSTADATTTARARSLKHRAVLAALVLLGCALALAARRTAHPYASVQAAAAALNQDDAGGAYEPKAADTNFKDGRQTVVAADTKSKAEVKMDNTPDRFEKIKRMQKIMTKMAELKANNMAEKAKLVGIAGAVEKMNKVDQKMVQDLASIQKEMEHINTIHRKAMKIGRQKQQGGVGGGDADDSSSNLEGMDLDFGGLR